MGTKGPVSSPKLGRGARFRCINCDSVVPDDYTKSEGRKGGIHSQVTAVIASSHAGIIYVSPSGDTIVSEPRWKPNFPLVDDHRNIWCYGYGYDTIDKLFSNRQLEALATFTELISDVYSQISDDFCNTNLLSSQPPATEYTRAIITYLSFAIDRSANYWSTLTPWGGGFIVQTFGRQALPMIWDYAEGNPFSSATGNWTGAVDWIARCLEVSVPSIGLGQVSQKDATSDIGIEDKLLVSTDPPYYDNISYADLSDYFYVWLRKSLKDYYPDLFGTVLVPKGSELIVAPHRHDGNAKEAKTFFEHGLSKAFLKIRKVQTQNYPVTVFYAFKQAESESEELSSAKMNTWVSTGWETMLESLSATGFQIVGTWPLHTERDQGLKTGTNVLASSIVLVCRPRSLEANSITRREFLAILKRELPLALRQLQLGNIAPVDLAQAAIGPGMAIFSRYKAVLESDGLPMRVRAALALINQALDEYLAEQEGEYDADTRWALAWFEQYGHDQGIYGIAETLSKAKNTSVEGLSHAGFLEARAGKVRLLKRDEMDQDWDPSRDKRLTAWEVAQYLIRTLDKEGEKGAGALLGKLGATGETARDLAYRLYTICERKGWAQEALAYNMLVVTWPRIN